MRDLGSGSAVLADADRKPCGEDVFGCVQIPVMGCSAVRARPCPDFETGHALRPGLRPAVGAVLRARIIPVDGYELASVPFGLVFEHSTELRPSGVHDAPVQPGFPGLPVGEPMVRIIRVGFGAHLLAMSFTLRSSSTTVWFSRIILVLNLWRKSRRMSVILA